MDSLKEQVGGTHYKQMAIQVVEFCHANAIPFMEGNVIKYVARHKQKNKLQDLLKAKHYLEMLIEMEYPQADNKPPTGTSAAVTSAYENAYALKRNDKPIPIDFLNTEVKAREIGAFLDQSGNGNHAVAADASYWGKITFSPKGTEFTHECNPADVWVVKDARGKVHPHVVRLNENTGKVQLANGIRKRLCAPLSFEITNQ